MKKFDFKLKNGTVKTMEFDEFVRWSCLIEGIDYITKACLDNKIVYRIISKNGFIL